MALPDLSTGRELDSDLLNSLPKGVVYQGNRTSVSSASTGTEISVLRLDGMTLLNGRTYELKTGNIRPSMSVGTDKVKVNLKYNSAGTATTASTEIGRWEGLAGIAAGAVVNSITPISGWVNPVADTAVGSLLFSFQRVAGTGSITINPDAGGLWLTVIDHGIVVADTGIDL